MRKHERRSVIRRILPPPSAPRVVRPGAAYRTEHVATKNERANVRHASLSEIVVDTDGAAFVLPHLLEEPRFDEPLMQFLAPLPQRDLLRLVWPSAVTVERDGETVHDESGHGEVWKVGGIERQDRHAATLHTHEQPNPEQRGDDREGGKRIGTHYHAFALESNGVIYDRSWPITGRLVVRPDHGPPLHSAKAPSPTCGGYRRQSRSISRDISCRCTTDQPWSVTNARGAAAYNSEQSARGLQQKTPEADSSF